MAPPHTARLRSVRGPGGRPPVAPRSERLSRGAALVRKRAGIRRHPAPHVRGAAEGSERDQRARQDPVGHPRPGPAAAASEALRAPDPERGAALPEGTRPHADVRRPRAARRAGGYDVARAARRGAGVRAAATITRTKAKLWSTIPTGSLGIGSPKTRMPPLIAVTLAAALVSVMTGTASPFWRPRAEA